MENTQQSCSEFGAKTDTLFKNIHIRLATQVYLLELRALGWYSQTGNPWKVLEKSVNDGAKFSSRFQLPPGWMLSTGGTVVSGIGSQGPLCPPATKTPFLGEF